MLSTAYGDKQSDIHILTALLLRSVKVHSSKTLIYRAWASSYIF